MTKYVTTLNPLWEGAEVYTDGSRLDVYRDDCPLQPYWVREQDAHPGLCVVNMDASGQTIDVHELPSELVYAAEEWGLDSPKFARYVRIFHPHFALHEYHAHGYSQGDYDDLLFIFDKRTDNASGLLVSDFAGLADALGHEYSSWDFGDVYRYEYTDKDGEWLDSCGGFYGALWDRRAGVLDHMRDDASIPHGVEVSEREGNLV